MGACALLLTRLQRTPRQSLWAWVILLVFIQGYFVKSYCSAAIVGTPEFAAHFVELRWLNLARIMDCYPYCAYAFTAFCGTAWLLMGIPETSRSVSESESESEEEEKRRTIPGAIRLFLFVAWLAGIATILQAILGIGVMGSDAARLPFRMDTVIFRFRSDLTPAIICLVFWIIDKSKERRIWILVVTTWVLLTFSDSVITASRSSFVRFGLPIIALWLLSGRLTRYRLGFMCGIALATILLFPFISAIRLIRMQESVGVIEAFEMSVLSGGEASSTSDGYSDVFVIFSRVVGVDGMWYAVDRMPKGLDFDMIIRHLFVEPLSMYFTRDIVGVVAQNDFRSPGLVGFFMLMASFEWVLFFIVLYILGVYCLWVFASRLKVAPVALAIIADGVLHFTMEGTMIVQNFISLFASIAMVSFLYRYLRVGLPLFKGDAVS